jgi:uncharacterized surface protein with fasciclin (FAS1) repeats
MKKKEKEMKGRNVGIWTVFGGVAILALAVASGPAWAGCGACGTHAAHGHGAKKNIVDTAVEAGDFTTLVTAVKAAGLVEALNGDGPFTLFAPNDAAFAKLPSGTVDSLLKDKDQLAAILTYHVVPGKLMASDIAGRSSAKSLQGKSITIDTSSSVKVDNAKVIKPDVMASNGVIHVIDTVMMP